MRNTIGFGGSRGLARLQEVMPLLEKVSGTPNADSLVGGDAPETIRGHAGNDTLWGMGGDDRLIGGEGDDLLYGGVGADSMFGGAGRDAFVVLGGADVIRGGAGAADVLSFNTAAATGGVSIDLSLSTTQATPDGSVRVRGVEQLWGTDFADQLRGDQQSNILWTWNGDDFAKGRGGDDTLIGGTGGDQGADTLFGGAGADMVSGDAGDDFLSGGGGDDRVVGDSGVDILLVALETIFFTRVSADLTQRQKG